MVPQPGGGAAGFAVAESGHVVASTDGETWKEVLAAGASHYWYGVHAWSADHAIITGFVDSASASLGVIRSVSGNLLGSSWSQQAPPPPPPPPPPVLTL